MNDSRKKILDLLQESESRYDGFLNGVKSLNELVPQINKEKEQVKWAKDLFENMPSQIVDKLDTNRIENIYGLQLDIIKKEILEINMISPTFNSVSGATGTASEVVFNQILPIQKDPNPLSMNYIVPHINKYMQIQTKQDRASSISKFISAVNPDLQKEFEEANTTFLRVDSGICDSKEAAIKMRNVLEGFLGNLVEKARQTPKENVKKTVSAKWDFFSKRLSVRGDGSVEYQILSSKHLDYTSLHKDLTDISKNLINDPLPKLREVYTQWIDHLYTTLFFIDINKL